MIQKLLPIPSRHWKFPRIIFGLMLIVFYTSSCQTNLNNAFAEEHTITIGMESTAVNALIFIAEDQNYFSENKLRLIRKAYPSGLAAVNGMLNGEVDVATASEFVIVGKVLAGEPVRTIGSIDKFLHNYLIGRKDQGIEQVSDLEGKRIGVPLKTAAEFYFGRFLELNGLNFNDLTLVNIAPPDLASSLLAGEVDAVVVWQPNAKLLEDQLGEQIVQWPVQNEQTTFCALISTSTWMDEHPEAVRPFLKAIAQAETYLTRQPDEARAILKKQLNYDDDYIATIWPEHQFHLSLDQSLILSMEDEARWMIKTGQVPQTQTPNFLEALDPLPLEAVKPNAVNIIR